MDYFTCFRVSEKSLWFGVCIRRPIFKVQLQNELLKVSAEIISKKIVFIVSKSSYRYITSVELKSLVKSMAKPYQVFMPYCKEKY